MTKYVLTTNQILFISINRTIDSFINAIAKGKLVSLPINLDTIQDLVSN